MTNHPCVALLTVALLAAGLAETSWAQSPSSKAVRPLDLDAGPSSGSEPDPLTPAERRGSALTAPGAPETAVALDPSAEVDPIITTIRQKLAGGPARDSAGHRDDVAGLTAFYGSGATQPLWVDKSGLMAKAKQAIAEIGRADDWGLKASSFELPTQPETITEALLAEAELDLSRAVLKYARHARGGRVEPSSVSRLFDQKPAIYEPITVLQAIGKASAPDAYLRDLHPKHPQFERLRQAMLAARGAVAENAAPTVKIPAGPTLKPGQDHKDVALLRERLAVAPPPGGGLARFDDALAAALKDYQRQRGLAATGVLNAVTRSALNGAVRTPATQTVQRLIVNMERWRWMPDDLGPHHVWASVPDQTTTVYDEGKPVLSEKMVVGKQVTPTPVFSADMRFIIFHPSWGVPPGIKTQELWPQLRNSNGGWFSNQPSASAVLNAHDLRVSRGGVPVNPDAIDWSSVDIRSFEFSQPPGPKNVLGIVKFRFPNKHDVYMHDTPERHLFGGAVRAFSHGCMRVQNPVRLAEVLLAKDKGWPAERVREYVRRGGEIVLTTPIPVHVTYFTAAVNADGKVDYRPDLYGLDGRLASALEGRSVHLVTASTSAPETASAGDQQPRAKSRARQKSVEPEAFNPFAAMFGN